MSISSLTEEVAALKARLDGIDGRFKTMEQRIFTNIAAREVNSIARLRNLQCAGSDDQRLYPLRSVSTNTEIENFPETVADFHRLSDRDIEGILEELGDPYVASHEDKRKNRQILNMLAGVHGQREGRENKGNTIGNRLQSLVTSERFP
ncbi:hypothetical protein F5Y10DRAFT_293981 [Nemania abortiva]|nr:hypothetical protein F5Y10DRAFT_293981 [Nemania abortiva]